MGIYSEYLAQQLDANGITQERKRQLKRIRDIRQRDVFVFAADLKKAGDPIQIGYPDLLPITDQLANLKGSALDLILETSGGSAEVTEQIVRILREQYSGDIAVVVPGAAMSAGTILAMAADDILMDAGSALGPIDAQLSWQGKVFSADALLKGFERIKQEVANTGVLNKAYIPILQGLSPGELESAQNALDLAKVLVTDWLAHYKFRAWTHHSSTGAPVTDDDRTRRAEMIAGDLCQHSRWRSHSRFFTIRDLERMRLRITDYSKQPDLADAIRRYFTLLQMTFESPIYKIFETPEAQVYRANAPVVPSSGPAVLDLQCRPCGTRFKIQVNVGRAAPLMPGHLPLPPDNQFRCPNCGTTHDLSGARRQIEQQTGQKVVS